jgi:hypothetical protein
LSFALRPSLFVLRPFLKRWGNDFRREIPALRDLSEMTGAFLRQLGSVPWRLDDETLAPEAGACSACPKRSSHVHQGRTYTLHSSTDSVRAKMPL